MTSLTNALTASSKRLFAYLVASSQGPLASWGRAVLCGVALWVAGGSAVVFAQTPPPCEPLLAAAEGRYVKLEFAEAEDLVRACLAQPERSDEETTEAYRLLALVFLRQDNLPEARQAVVRLLGVSFAYAPDPVRDPPDYVALVASIKDQLRVEGVTSPPSDSSGIALPGPPADIATPDPGRDVEPDVDIVRTDPEGEEDPAPTAERAPTQNRRGLVRWLLIGGGVVAAGVAAVLLTSGDAPAGPSGGSPLPPPPAFPR